MTRWKRSKTKPFWPRERPQARGLPIQRGAWPKSSRLQRWRENAHGRLNRVLKKRAPGRNPVLGGFGQWSPIAESAEGPKTPPAGADVGMLAYQHPGRQKPGESL
jgi:hypothetical protein